MTKTTRYTFSTIGPFDITWIGHTCVVKCHEQETMHGIHWNGERINGDGFYFMTREATPARALLTSAGAWLVVHI